MSACLSMMKRAQKGVYADNEGFPMRRKLFFIPAASQQRVRWSRRAKSLRGGPMFSQADLIGDQTREKHEYMAFRYGFYSYILSGCAMDVYVYIIPPSTTSVCPRI